MSKMKDLLTDVLDSYDKGYSIHEIANLYELRQETVVAILEEWGTNVDYT
jgi:orotate phosphoribosyltransferase-like protein